MSPHPYTDLTLPALLLWTGIVLASSIVGFLALTGLSRVLEWIDQRAMDRKAGRKVGR